jgi:hypothetical protein
LDWIRIDLKDHCRLLFFHGYTRYILFILSKNIVAMRSARTGSSLHSFRTLFVLLAFLLTSATTGSAAGLADEEGVFRSIKQKYDTLSSKGKFAAGCTIGFVGSRVALHTAVSCIKIGAAAYIT